MVSPKCLGINPQAIAFPDLVKYKPLLTFNPIRVDPFFRIPQVSPGAIQIISLRSLLRFNPYGVEELFISFIRVILCTFFLRHWLYSIRLSA
jgi:hypothetical protein